jgi:DNA-directed RNA polymerase subunit RPC12/RpoP
MEMRRDQWLNQMDAQDNKCAECGAELEVDLTAKRALTREIICQTCYRKPLGAVNVG